VPLITDQQSVAANATIANAIAGDRFEFPPGGKITKIRGGIVADATGMTATFSVGDRIIAENYPVPVEEAVGVVSKLRDFNWQANAKPGERIVVQLVNTTAGALVTTLLLELT